MPFTYSCFISYRHTEMAGTRAIIQQTVDALKTELELRVPLPVYLDEDRLRGGTFYNEALATSLCTSVCMVMLYWPTYFSVDHTFCSREYRAMEDLEQQRLALLTNLQDRQNGLIIPIAFRGFRQIPPAIRQNRHIYDFEPYTLRPKMTRLQGFRDDIHEIGSYISDRCQSFQGVPPPDPCGNCNQSTFPTEQSILIWLQGLMQGIPATPYPTREPGR